MPGSWRNWGTASAPEVSRAAWRDRQAGVHDLFYPCGVDLVYMAYNNAKQVLANTLILLPYAVPEAQTIAKVRSRCRFTKAGQKIGYGIYACGAAGSLQPGALLAEVNGLAMTLGWVDGAFNYAAPAGTKLWIGMVADADYLTKFWSAQATRGIGFVAADVEADSYPTQGFTCAHVYNGAAMPDPLPALTLYKGDNGDIPILGVGGY